MTEPYAATAGQGRVVGYMRVSTVDQAEHGYSLSEQERQITHLAQAYHPGKESILWTDGVSGSIPLRKRPKGSEMLAALQRGDTLIVAKLDRIFRDAVDAFTQVEKFIADGIDFVSLDMGNEPITRDGISNLLFKVLAVIAEFERRRMHERSAESREQRRAQGIPLGGNPPWGKRIVGSRRDARYEDDERELQGLALMRTRYLAGDTWAAIAREFNRQGYRNREGNQVQGKFVSNILKRDKTLIASVNRQTASERMKQIIAEKRARGEPLPHNPNLPEARRLSAATRAAKVAERDAKIEPVIRKIMAAGEVSYNRVAATLSAANIPAPKGGRWSADSARRVMGRLNIPSPFRPGRPSPNRHIKLAEAKALDSAGISKAEIAKRLGISITTVYQYLRPTDHPPAAAKQSHSIHRRVKRSLATQEKMRVLALREEGHSAAQIARLMGISRDKVYRILREAGSPTGLTFAKSKQAEIRESHRGGANVGEISEKTGFSRRAIYRMLAGKANSEQPDQEDNNNTITVVDALSLAVWEGQMLQTIWELQAIGFYTHSAIAAELNQRGILNQRILSGQKAGIDGTWNASTVRYFLHKHGNDGPPPELLQKTLASFDAGILPAIRQLRDEGYTTPAELAPQLNKRGLKTLASRYWGVGTVEQLLQRTGLSDVPAIPMQSNSSAAPTVSEPSDTEQRTPDPSRMRGLQPHSLSHTALNLRIARWVDERCLRSADGKTRADDLYRDFCTWAEACGEAFPSTITFNRFLGVIAQTRSGPDRNNCRWFYGLVLRPSDDDPLAARKQHRFAQEMLPLIKKLQPICFYSNAQVARKLNARKKYTLNGRHWTKTDVEQILESENTPAKRAKSLRSSAVVMGTQSPI